MTQPASPASLPPSHWPALGRCLGNAAAALLLAAPALLLLVALPALTHGADPDDGKFERPREPAALQRPSAPAAR